MGRFLTPPPGCARPRAQKASRGARLPQVLTHWADQRSCARGRAHSDPNPPSGGGIKRSTYGVVEQWSDGVLRRPRSTRTPFLHLSITPRRVFLCNLASRVSNGSNETRHYENNFE